MIEDIFDCVKVTDPKCVDSELLEIKHSILLILLVHPPYFVDRVFLEFFCPHRVVSCPRIGKHTPGEERCLYFEQYHF